jgi:ABC-type multidrug transport system fused ATPase/permease subunit
LVQLAQDVLVVAGVLAVMLYLDWPMGGAVILMVLAIAGIFQFLNPKLQQTSRDVRRRRTRLSAHLNGRIKGLEVVKSYGRQRDENRWVRKLNGRVADCGTQREAAGGMLLGTSAGTVALFTVLVLGLASGEVASGRLTAGELVTFYALIGLLAPIFQRITMTDRTLQEAHISMHRLSQTLAEEPESPRESELPALEVSEGSVSVEEVSFTYPDGTVALENVSLTARRGELVVIAGSNGAGKSTLLELLPRSREPTSGRVVVDGQDITEVSLDSLRSQIGYVTQDTPLFDGTIAENVSYGVPGDTSKEQIKNAARLARVDEIVAALPDGWETKVSEGRRMLSDGQRQRVALARVLVTDSPILVLDQAAAAVDAENFQALLETVCELAQDKTVIIATHHPAALLAADRIYVLEEGRALEVSARALREHHEGGHGKDTGPIFAELSAARAFVGSRTLVRAAPMRKETEDDDHGEDDD